MRVTDGLAIELDNELPEIDRFNELFQEFATRHALSDRLVFQVSLAFEELVTNTISYGYPQGGRHKIRVALDIVNDVVTVELVDDGIAYDPLARSIPDTAAPMEERGIGGLGVLLARKMMDSLDYRREKGQNRLVMTKRIVADHTQE